MVRRHHLEYGESAISVIADDSFLPCIREAVLEARASIEAVIASDPFFASTMEPYDLPVPEGVPRRMCEASALCGVGPMAAVAGAIAEHAVRAAVREGCPCVLIDNGGDIAIHSDREIRVGLYGGPRPLSLLVPPVGDVLGICSSSGRIGPAISLGEADIATVISPNPTLADAAATRLGNLARSDDPAHLRACLDDLLSIEGVSGAILGVGGALALQGDVPPLGAAGPVDHLATRRQLGP